MDWIMLLLKCCPSNPCHYFTVTTQAFKKKGSFFLQWVLTVCWRVFFSGVMCCIASAEPMVNLWILVVGQMPFCWKHSSLHVKKAGHYGIATALNPASSSSVFDFLVGLISLIFEVSEFFEAITRQRAFRKRTAVCHLRTFAEAWEHCRCQVQRGMFSTLLCGTSCMHLNFWVARCCITHCGMNAKTM